MNLDPQTLDDIVGQDHIIKELRRASKKDNFGGSYILLYGGSETGKSTIAQIIAKTLNCKKTVIKRDGTKEPCNKCEVCDDVNSGRFKRDVMLYPHYEISQNLFDLLNKDMIFPSRYDNRRVIIIDGNNKSFYYWRQYKENLYEKTQEARKDANIIFCFNKIKELNENELKQYFRAYKLKDLTHKDITNNLSSLLKREKVKIPNTHEKEFIKQVIPTIVANSNKSISTAKELLTEAVEKELWTLPKAKKVLKLYLKMKSV